MTEEMEDLEPQEEFELEPISRKVTLRLRVGLKYETVDSEIIEIQEDGKIVLISPMSGSRPRPAPRRSAQPPPRCPEWGKTAAELRRPLR